MSESVSRRVQVRGCESGGGSGRNMDTRGMMRK